MMGFGYGYNGFGRCSFIGGGFGMMFIALILIGIVVYTIFRQKNTSVKNESGSDNALEILNERFARGEINEEEYKQRKTLLLKHF